MDELTFPTRVCSAHQDPDPMCGICNPRIAALEKQVRDITAARDEYLRKLRDREARLEEWETVTDHISPHECKAAHNALTLRLKEAERLLAIPIEQRKNITDKDLRDPDLLRWGIRVMAEKAEAFLAAEPAVEEERDP